MFFDDLLGALAKFDGHSLNWVMFWKQFEAAIYSNRQLSDTDKLTYLQQVVKNGTARDVNEGLSQAGNNYLKAVDRLRMCCNRPCLIHCVDVQAILNAPPLRNGHGKELCCLDDAINQHLRTLKAMSCDPSGPFITSI